jgi:hypothetical protein
MFNYMELTPAGALERLNSLIAKAHGKSETERGSRVLVSKNFLIRIHELMTGQPYVIPVSVDKQVHYLAVLKEGYNDQKVWNKLLTDNPYKLDTTENADYRLWMRGWWLATNKKPEPTEV